MEETLQAQHLTKRFLLRRGWRDLLHRDSPTWLTVVEGVSLTIRRGEIFGLLGLNGAGKTTLVRMLCGLLPPSEGDATVLGLDLLRQTRLVRATVGLCSGEDRSFYWRLTARQNLAFFAELYGLGSEERRRRVPELLDLFGLTNEADRPVSQFSTGMRQKLSLARALLHRPRLLFLDEPTRGLDLQAAESLLAIIKDQLTAKEGITVFLTTHQLNEAQQLCHRVGILHHGRLQAVGEPEALAQQLGWQKHYRIHVQGLTPAELESLQQQSPAVISKQVDGTSIVAFNSDETFTLDDMLRRLQALNAHISDIEYAPPSLANVVRQLVS